MPQMTDYEKTIRFWKQKHITTGAQLEEALRGHQIAAAFYRDTPQPAPASCCDTRELFQPDAPAVSSTDLRTHFESRNIREAYQLFLRAFQTRRPLGESFLKELHFRLTRGTYDTRRWQSGERPGEYKHHDYVAGKEEIGADPADVSGKMRELLDTLQHVPRGQALPMASYFHAEFEHIHPFADGNGRTGRLAMNYFLVLHEHPPIVVNEQDCREYYAALEHWDIQQDIAPLYHFFRRQAEKTWAREIQQTPSADLYRSTLYVHTYEDNFSIFQKIQGDT